MNRSSVREAISRRVRDQDHAPWFANPCCRQFFNDAALSAADIRPCFLVDGARRAAIPRDAPAPHRFHRRPVLIGSPTKYLDSTARQRADLRTLAMGAPRCLVTSAADPAPSAPSRPRRSSCLWPGAAFLVSQCPHRVYDQENRADHLLCALRPEISASVQRRLNPIFQRD